MAFPSLPLDGTAEAGVHVAGHEPVAIVDGKIEQVEFGEGCLGESQRLAGAENETADADCFQ